MKKDIDNESTIADEYGKVYPVHADRKRPAHTCKSGPRTPSFQPVPPLASRRPDKSIPSSYQAHANPRPIA